MAHRPNRPLVPALLLALVVAGCGSVAPASPSASATPSPSTASTPAATPATTASPDPSPTPTPSPVAEAVPFVPVVAFRSPIDSVGRRDLAAVLGEGDAGGAVADWSALELVADEADAILASLQVERPADPRRLVLASTAAALAADLAAHPDRLGFLRAAAVGPSVRAVGWGKRELFGNERVRDLADWPLRADGLSPDAAPFDPATTWTMFAGGDMGVDRGMVKAVRILGKGVDYPFSGGAARITGTTCCTQFGWAVPTIAEAGDPGAMRRLISGADVAIANLEGPVADRFTYHTHGTVFTGDPALLAGIVRAGMDVVTLANNHIGDAGRQGVVQSVRNVERAGLLHAGAGANLAAARKPAWVETAGTRVAILSYDAIAIAWYAATAAAPGSAPLLESYVRKDIAAARKAGADVIVVWPHWGVEYTRGPSDAQQRLGHAMIDAGADLVIGNHPHWVQAVEVYRGRPIWYALGNFTFDQNWSERTLEGITLELTFRGATLVQARMHPHVNVLSVQPNLLDPAGSGRRILDPVWEASKALLPW